jgi:hypothetical protein
VRLPNDFNPFAELQIYARETLDLEDTGTLIEQRLGDRLLPPPQGVYVTGVLEPVMVPGGRYFARVRDPATGSVRVLEVKTLKGLKNTSVFKVNGNPDTYFQPSKDRTCSFMDQMVRCTDEQLVLTQTHVNNANYQVSNYPFLPYRGIYLAELMIQDTIALAVEYPYADFGLFVDELRKHIREEYWEDWGSIRSDLEAITSDLKAQVLEFIGNYKWHLYFCTNRPGGAVMIEKSIDWRAHQWNQQQAREQQLAELAELPSNEFLRKN